MTLFNLLSYFCFPQWFLLFSSFFFTFLANSLLFPTGFYCGVLEARHLNQDNKIDSFDFDYISFTRDIDILSRACGARLLTSDARFAAVQQNIHIILKLLFGNYELTENSFDDIQPRLHQRLKIHEKSNGNTIYAFNENSIEYDQNQKCLVMIKAERNGQNNVLSLKYYPIKAQLPSVKTLYNRAVSHGIDFDLVLRLFSRIIRGYEASFKLEISETLDLTKTLNTIVKKFIWNYCHIKGKDIKQPPISIMRHLSKKLFKKNLSAQLYTIKQGHREQLCAHLSNKPCTIYDGVTFSSISYPKTCIKYIEHYKLPICPSVTKEEFQDNLFYCIYVYCHNEARDLKIDSSKKYEKEKTKSLLKAAIPLMRVSEGIVLSTYIVFPKKHFINFASAMMQKAEFKQLKDKINENIPSSYLEISDGQLRIFMTHFANYLYTDANQDLFGVKILG